MSSMHTLVIGSGLSGLVSALKLAPHSTVTVVSKAALHSSNSWRAQGGIAAVDLPQDSVTTHMQDTLRLGDGLSRQSIVKMVVQDGPRVVQELREWGVPFSQQGSQVHLTREGGHSQRRVWHIEDRTGEGMVEVIWQQVQKHPQITMLDQHLVVDLLTTDQIKPSFQENRCLGAYVYDLEAKRITVIRADCTLLCTGGHGRAYLYTSNPAPATGDGIAMAWRAGAKIANLEFMQFHPTCLYHHRQKNVLISESLRGEGAKLINKRGEDFMASHHGAGSLAPRDVLARAIYHELKTSGEDSVFLDVSGLAQHKLEQQFRNTVELCADLGIDVVAGDPIPVVPCAHYSCGGVMVDEWGKTSIGRLYAVGEVACTGLHGGNRLASNSLLELCVFAHRASAAILQQSTHPDGPLEVPAWDYHGSIQSDELGVLGHTWDEIRRIMWNYVGIVRTTKRLKRAFTKLSALRSELDEYYWNMQPRPELIEVKNLAEVAYLTVMCALKRKESRGCHYTKDYPHKSSYVKDTVI